MGYSFSRFKNELLAHILLVGEMTRICILSGEHTVCVVSVCLHEQLAAITVTRADTFDYPSSSQFRENGATIGPQ